MTFFASTFPNSDFQLIAGGQVPALPERVILSQHFPADTEKVKPWNAFESMYEPSALMSREWNITRGVEIMKTLALESVPRRPECGTQLGRTFR